ncbi:MAG: heavy metal-binding domain-containing protein [Bacilli bacterium]|nr:heavy metal-binding domain-containing protein [Bacilli bacterium]
MEDFIISTTHLLDGYEVTEYLDVLFEESIFGISFSTSMKSFGDMFKGWTGERLNAISDRIEEVKSEVKNELIAKAKKMGANAIIGVDIETTRNMNDGNIGVSISGTAVIVRKVNSKS